MTIPLAHIDSGEYCWWKNFPICSPCRKNSWFLIKTFTNGFFYHRSYAMHTKGGRKCLRTHDADFCYPSSMPLAHRFRWRPSTCINVPYKKTCFCSAGFPTSVVPFFKEAGFQVLRCSFCFGDNLATSDLDSVFYYTGFGSMGFALRKLWKYICWMFPQASQQADQNTWRKTNHTELDMSRPSYRLNVWTLFFGGGDGTPYKFWSDRTRPQTFVQSSKSESNCCCDERGS